MHQYGRRLRVTFFACAAWLLTPFRRLGDVAVKVEVARLLHQNRQLRDDIDRLGHELLLQKQRADAADQNAEVLLSAQETNLKFLDHMVLTHGINSTAR